MQMFIEVGRTRGFPGISNRIKHAALVHLQLICVYVVYFMLAIVLLYVGHTLAIFWGYYGDPECFRGYCCYYDRAWVLNNRDYLGRPPGVSGSP